MTCQEAYNAVYAEQMEITCDAIHPAFVTKAKKQYVTFKDQLIDCFTSFEIVKFNPTTNDFEYYDAPPPELEGVEWREYTG